MCAAHPAPCDNGAVTVPAVPAFRLHVSNRLEDLAAALAEEIRAEPGDPLAPERIVVPHPVLGRWLALELATHLGVAAHLKLTLPAEFAWSLMRSAVELPKEQPFAPGALRWRIFNALARWNEDDDLSRYLADGDARKRFALSDRLAHVYDRCLLYRPQWIRGWETGQTPHWQARLWGELAMSGASHWVDAVDAFTRAMRGRDEVEPAQLDLFDRPSTAPAPRDDMPRVTFFAVPSLSPSYLEMLRAAGVDNNVQLFQLSPCREFWADTRGRRELPRTAVEDPTLTEGNELLAAWGRAARDMQTLLADDLGVGDPDEVYRAPGEETRLGLVQTDILELRLGADAAEAEAVQSNPRDDSIEIHVCHSATREAEVLHDCLLGLFDAHDDIQPADVLVLTPHMDEYAPAIEAVFDAHRTIPFNIGRLRRRDGAAVRAFLDLLALPGSRYAVSQVMAPLRAASVAAQFRIADADLPEIRAWIANAGIHWGMGEHDVPASDKHTWQAGLNRLLLGYAVAGSADWFGDVASSTLDRFGNDGPDRYERLGRFARYAELAFALDELGREALPPADWAGRLRERVLTPFFAAEHPLAEVAREADLVARLIEDLESEWSTAGVAKVASEEGADGVVPFAVVRDVLGELGAASSRAVARLADGVTVAPLAAGQVFPAKVVCTVGMNDRAFPRHRAPATFDLVYADVRRPGDRDLRDEDRLAFLEALLGARRAFVVTYTGRDLREDASIPPSVVVSELLDYLAQRFPGDETWATPHPLQPFNRRYFDAKSPALFSYSETMAQAAMVARDTPAPDSPTHRLAGVLAPLDGAEAEVEVPLTELIRFAAHPVRHFARNRLGLRLEIEDDDPATDEEPLELDYLQQWQLKDELFALPTSAEPLVRARGLLPPGNLGVNEHRRGAIQVATLRRALEPHEAHLEAPPAMLDVDVGGCRITGWIDGYLPESAALLWWRIGRIRDKDRIEVWLQLLALTCANETALSAHVVGVTNAPQREAVCGPAPGAAREMLERWLQAWRRGTSEPLPFFPETSSVWVREQDRGKAERTWDKEMWSESQDPYHQLLCPDGPDAADFEPLADALLGPLLERWQVQ